jgi:hypothetical protein
MNRTRRRSMPAAPTWCLREADLAVVRGGAGRWRGTGGRAGRGGGAAWEMTRDGRWCGAGGRWLPGADGSGAASVWRMRSRGGDSGVAAVLAWRTWRAAEWLGAGAAGGRARDEILRRAGSLGRRTSEGCAQRRHPSHRVLPRRALTSAGARRFFMTCGRAGGPRHQDSRRGGAPGGSAAAGGGAAGGCAQCGGGRRCGGRLCAMRRAVGGGVPAAVERAAMCCAPVGGRCVAGMNLDEERFRRRRDSLGFLRRQYEPGFPARQPKVDGLVRGHATLDGSRPRQRCTASRVEAARRRPRWELGAFRPRGGGYDTFMGRNWTLTRGPTARAVFRIACSQVR